LQRHKDCTFRNLHGYALGCWRYFVLGALYIVVQRNFLFKPSKVTVYPRYTVLETSFQNIFRCWRYQKFKKAGLLSMFYCFSVITLYVLENCDSVCAFCCSSFYRLRGYGWTYVWFMHLESRILRRSTMPLRLLNKCMLKWISSKC
jgi:hypothetical protein